MNWGGSFLIVNLRAKLAEEILQTDVLFTQSIL